MTIEKSETQIKFIHPDQDAGKMANVIKTIYDALLEQDSLKEIIKGAIDSGYERYRETVDDSAKKGDYSSFVKGQAQEMFDNGISEKITKMENILDYNEIVRQHVK